MRSVCCTGRYLRRQPYALIATRRCRSCYRTSPDVTLSQSKGERRPDVTLSQSKRERCPDVTLSQSKGERRRFEIDRTSQTKTIASS